MYLTDIKQEAKHNDNFRKVLHTGKHCQIVAMALAPNEEIGEEVHPQTDQLLFIVDGKGKAIVEEDHRDIEEHDVVFVEAGAKHNVINTHEEPLKLFTIYAPPAHKDGFVAATKEEAEKEESY